MKKRNIIIAILALLVITLVGGALWLYNSLQEKEQQVNEMQELAELDKQEMQDEYQRFTMQYSEMRTQISNDSIVAQLAQEQMRTQQLLEELKQVKATDAREITRLKKELATVRAVLRSYVIQIDSLNRLNENLQRENSQMQQELEASSRQIEGLNSEKQTLSQKVAIAAQLDATGIQLTMKNKRGKDAKKVKDAKTLQVQFNIARNVTAQNGVRNVYVRIQTPSGTTLNGGGTFAYENRQLEYSMKKAVEYSGEETPVVVYWQVNEFLSGGDYRVSIFADGQMIGSRTFAIN